jgi:ribonucleoside-triphosphate reductase
MTYVTESFTLPPEITTHARTIDPMFGYNGFSEYLFYKHYSRVKYFDGIPYGQENWWDSCIRVIEGTFAVRKSHYVHNRIAWPKQDMMDLAEQMLYGLVRMKWLMGRGLWAMGTDQVAQRGGMALYNCAYCELGTQWIDALCWAMDCSMHGVGVGFGIKEAGLILKEPRDGYTYVVDDSREGWVASLEALLTSFIQGHDLPELDTHLVRPKGSPIVTFGGVASGPEPLVKLHEIATERLYMYCAGDIDETTLKADLANIILICVVAGNVRRSAGLLVADLFAENLGGDGADLNDTFLKLKTIEDRKAWSWMSNNSVRLQQDPCFEELPNIARLNTQGADIGYLNMQTFPYPRLGRGMDGLREDKATGINPCGEIPLEDREVCNLAETCPTRCVDVYDWYDACKFATFYLQTVSLLATHHPCTNVVIARNRRIGVSIMDIVNWKQETGTALFTKYLRRGYDHVREYAAELAAEAGVPSPIRHTTIKPGGTTPKLASRGSGVSHPTFRLIKRRVRVGYHEPMYQILHNAGVPEEADVNDGSCACFAFPIDMSSCPPATEVSIWEQALNVVLLQREWSDNAVSNTLYYRPRWECVGKGNLNNLKEHVFCFTDVRIPDDYVRYNLAGLYANRPAYSDYRIDNIFGSWRVNFDRETDDWKIYKENVIHEEHQLEAVLASIAPHTKSVSLLPHSGKGLFPQMPEEELTKAEYNEMLRKHPKFDWSKYICESEEIRGCESDRCIVKQK